MTYTGWEIYTPQLLNQTVELITRDEATIGTIASITKQRNNITIIFCYGHSITAQPDNETITIQPL